jgi:hypothetical protein
MMLFVGRENEKKKIIGSLRHGNNIVLGGKFGMGRTSIIKETANLLADERKFIFIDFNRTPGDMSKNLMKVLGISTRIKKSGVKMGYKSMRHRIAHIESPKGKKTVIVFDNIAKITPQKIIFLRHLILEGFFQFIAIVENFLPASHLMLLKTQLVPVDSMLLNYLKEEDVISFIRLYSEKYHLNWPDAYIHGIAALTGGYPLNIIETLRLSSPLKRPLSGN